MRMHTFGALLIGGAVALTGCGGDGGPTGGGGNGDGNGEPPPGGDVVEVNLTSSLRFQPASVEIEPGTTVRWIYQGGDPHTVTPDNPDQEGVWESQEMNSVGQEFEHTFEVAGTFDYHCIPHQSVGMVGTIQVTEGSSSGNDSGDDGDSSGDGDY